jgi:hypothetical protein
MATESFDVLMAAARTLQRRFPPKDHAYFTHIPINVSPEEALRVVRGSPFGALLLTDDAVMNEPTLDWYKPVVAVRADESTLVDAYISVSLWEPPQWALEIRAQLEVRFVFGDDPRCDQCLSAWASASQGALLDRSVYDHQRADQGYEGENVLTAQPSDDDVSQVVSIVLALATAEQRDA